MISNQVPSQFTEAYRRPIHWALAQQLVVSTLCLLALDGGVLARECALVLMAFWSGALLIMMRRPVAPTSIDLRLIQFGFVPLMLLVELLSMLFHRFLLQTQSR